MMTLAQHESGQLILINHFISTHRLYSRHEMLFNIFNHHISSGMIEIKSLEFHRVINYWPNSKKKKIEKLITFHRVDRNK